MSVQVKYDEGTDTHSLGASIDGAFVPFVSIDGVKVRAQIESAQAAEREGNSSSSGSSTESTAQINADDYTDNGDGSYTRKSDNAQGRFTPTGFEPITQ